MHIVEPFLNNSRYCRGSNVQPVARSSRKRESLSCTSGRKILPSMVSAVNGDCRQWWCCCKWCQEHHNMQEHTPCLQSCIAVSERIIAFDHSSTKMHILASFLVALQHHHLVLSAYSSQLLGKNIFSVVYFAP